ncbi:rna-directed dna polymerase from mobile element jockey-like [Pitangus sulphuratus]|nr:rna-directed dna polymerase from mobile element jockey-like [Pitangus sulphuratus]
MSHSILLEKRLYRGSKGCTLHWVKNWLGDWTQRVDGLKSSWHSVTTEPQGSVLGPIPFNILVYDLDEWIKDTFSKSTDGIRLGRSVDLLEGKKALQRDLDRLDQWVEANDMKFNKVKRWALPSSHNSHMQQCSLGKEWLESCPAKKNLVVLIDRS